jgi:hypothetical protein
MLKDERAISVSPLPLQQERFAPWETALGQSPIATPLILTFSAENVRTGRTTFVHDAAVQLDGAACRHSPMHSAIYIANASTAP